MDGTKVRKAAVRPVPVAKGGSLTLAGLTRRLCLSFLATPCVEQVPAGRGTVSTLAGASAAGHRHQGKGRRSLVPFFGR
ncbi:MAG: hypothetical protein H5U38_00325 [Calditrichaeota bacterium]|nr:hypothetical protein [Calditrichota bacterium]